MSWKQVSRLALAGFVVLASAGAAFAQDEPAPDDSGVAVLDVNAGVLHVVVGHEDGALEALGATPTGDGRWQASVGDVLGGVFDKTFDIAPHHEQEFRPYWPTPASQLVPCPHPNIKVYKNARCGSLLFWEVYPPPNPCQPAGPGLWKKVTKYDHNRCINAPGSETYCVDETRIISRTEFFGNGGCTGAPLTGATYQNGPVCK